MKTNLTSAKPGDRLQLYCRFPGSDEATPMHNGELVVFRIDGNYVEAKRHFRVALASQVYRFRRSTGREPGTLYCAKPVD